MTNRFLKVSLMSGLGALMLASAAAAGPVERVTVTPFRSRVPVEKIRVEFKDLAKIKTDAQQFDGYLFRLFKEGGNVIKEGKPTLGYDHEKAPEGVRKKYAELETSHKALMDEVTRLEKDKTMSEADKLKQLQSKIEDREKALEALTSEAKRSGMFALTDGGNWGPKGAFEAFASSGGKRGTPAIDPKTGKPTEHDVAADASGSGRATGNVTRAQVVDAFPEMFGTTDKSVVTRMSKVGCKACGEAVRSIYSEENLGTMDNEMKERAVLVAEKAVEIMKEIDRLKSEKDEKGRPKLKISKEKLAELLESMIRSGASPAEMEAIKQMALNFEADAGAGLSRMVAMDLYLKKGAKGADGKNLAPGEAAARLGEWLSSGESFRSLMSPDTKGMTPEQSKSIMALSKTAKDIWAKGEKFAKAEDFVEKVRKAMGEKEFTAEHEAMVRKAAEELLLAREGKGADEQLRKAICESPECSKHFRCK